MEGYKTLTEAVAMALKVCSSWYGAETEETYGIKEISYIAQIIDRESPNESDEIFYSVFPDGEIGILCTYDRSIHRLFIPSDSDFVPSRDMLIDDDDAMIPDAAMPQANTLENSVVTEVTADPEPDTEPGLQQEYYYCIYCGEKVNRQYRFCPKCGKKIEVQ